MTPPTRPVDAGERPTEPPSPLTARVTPDELTVERVLADRLRAIADVPDFAVCRDTLLEAAQSLSALPAVSQKCWCPECGGDPSPDPTSGSLTASLTARVTARLTEAIMSGVYDCFDEDVYADEPNKQARAVVLAAIAPELQDAERQLREAEGRAERYREALERIANKNTDGYGDFEGWKLANEQTDRARAALADPQAQGREPK